MNSDRPTPLNIESLCQRYKVVPKGIIHIGAHEGQELAKYLQMGATEVLLIEANPEIYQKLQTKIADIPNVSALNYAICDRQGKIDLRLNSYDYSSSILPLKQHQDIYPNMLEVGAIEVEARTLDQVLKEQRINNPESNSELDRQFNILAIDIQGAELLALEGAKETIRNIDAIYTEVNLQELYEGCALLEQIDQFLAGYQFQRVAIKTPFHPFYGDAFYLKTDILAKSQTTIVTSIAPHNYEQQRLAIDSWRSHGFQPVSLNCAEEVSELRSLYPDVIFHAVVRHAGAEVGKPLLYLDSIFDYLQNHLSSGNGIFAIVNADIQLKLDFDTQLLIENEAKQSLVVSSRVEIKEPSATTGQIYTRGFDAFFFDAELLAKIPKSNYCLGMPWWDFWLPLMAQQNQIAVKYLAEPIAYHVQHQNNYSSQLWQKYGIQFTQLFDPELGAKFEYIQKNNLPDLQPQLIGVIDTFLQSFHHHSQRLHNMSGQILTQAINSEAAQLHLETGNIYREQGKFVEAIASYQKALISDPNYAPAYLGLAKIYLATAKLELAIESISHIQALQPEILSCELYLQSAKLLSQRREWHAAISQLQYGIKLVDYSQPSLLLEAYILQGQLYVNLDDFDRSISSYHQAIAIDPKSAAAHWQLSQTLQQLSISYQQDALDLQPDLIDLAKHFEMGLNFSSQGRINWSIRAYQRAIRLKPDWAEAYSNLGNALGSINQVDDAIKNFKKAIALNPNLIEAYSNLGNALVRIGEVAEGINYHHQAIKLKPTWAELHFNLGDALVKVNRIPEAIVALSEAIKLKPQLAEAQQLLGKVLLAKGQASEAIPHLQIAIKLKPDWTDAYRNLGKALIDLEQIPEAIAIYQNLIAVTSDHNCLAFAYWDLGVAHWLLNQTSETATCFLKAVELNPQLADVYQGLCTLLRIGGNFAASRQAADNYAKNCENSDQVRVLVTLLKCYLESGLNNIAKDHFQKLAEIFQRPNVILQASEVRLIYEDLIFSLPYLRDRIDLNGQLSKIIGAAYTQLCLPVVPETQVSPKSLPAKKKSKAPLRIGVISKHLRRHSVGWCSRGIIKEWAKLTPDLHLYQSGRGECDDLTAEFKLFTDNFFDFSAKSNLELLAKLQSDDLDILIDMDSVMNPNHALILHHAPARAVISWLGCEPPFISSKNYYLCDRHTHPESVQPHYQEQLIYMPDFTVAIGEFPSKLVDRAAVRKELGIAADTIAFLSLATGHKVNPDSVRSHISILNQVPNSILIHKGFCDLEVVRSLYQTEAEKVGLDFARCQFITRQPLEEDHRLFYQVADIGLDTYPYNGGTHNLESIWFNLPIVTLCGEQATSRMGYSFLKAVGISEGVANNWEEYIAWGVKLGTDADLRHQLQNRLKQSKHQDSLSPLWNPKKFAIDSYGLFEILARK